MLSLLTEKGKCAACTFRLGMGFYAKEMTYFDFLIKKKNVSQEYFCKRMS